MSTPTTFPLFIVAKSKEDLSREMLKNNLVHGSFFKYFDIQKDGKDWVAWFYADANTHQNLIKELSK